MAGVQDLSFGKSMNGLQNFSWSGTLTGNAIITNDIDILVKGTAPNLTGGSAGNEIANKDYVDNSIPSTGDFINKDGSVAMAANLNMTTSGTPNKVVGLSAGTTSGDSVRFNEFDTLSDAVALNTAKVGISTSQADAIVANTAKVGISTSQADAIVANTDKVGISTSQADAIVANTAKVGISTSQANAIVANTAKVGTNQNSTTTLNLNSNDITNIGSVSQFSLPDNHGVSGRFLKTNADGTTEWAVASGGSSIWTELTAGSAYDTATLIGTQVDKAVAIGYNTAALPKADLVRLYVFDNSTAVVTRNQSATIQLDTIATTTFGQIKADNTGGGGTSANLFLTGRGGVNIQHTLPADGVTTTITTTTKSSFNTQAGMAIGAGFTAEPESSIVAGGTLNNTNPTQKGIHLGDVSDFGVVQLCGSNGGTVEFTDQSESGTTTFNSRILYDNVGQPTNFDLTTWTNRPTGQSTSYEWLAGCGNVVLNTFQGLNFFNPSSAPTREYSIGREAGVWTSPFPNLALQWGTGIKFITDAAVSATLSTFKFYFDATGTTAQAEISNGGKIDSNFNPMIYAAGVTTAAGTGFLRQRNTTSISLTATGQYTITLAITMPSTNYGVNISPEASACVGFVFNKTLTTFDVVTYIAQSGGVATLSFSYSVIDFE